MATLSQFARTHADKWAANLYKLELDRDGYKVSANDNAQLQEDMSHHRKTVAYALCAKVCETSFELKKYATESLEFIFQRQ